MSEIKLENASNCLEELLLGATEGPAERWSRQRQALKDFQDRTLETAVAKLEPMGYEKAIDYIRSLKNAQPEVEVDRKTEQLLADVVGAAIKLMNRPIKEGEYALNLLTRDYLAHCNSILKSTEPTAPATPDSDWRELLVEATERVGELKARLLIDRQFNLANGAADFLGQCRAMLANDKAP